MAQDKEFSDRLSINSYGADFSVDQIVSMFDRGDIYIPDFQRRYVWTETQASLFVESLLVGLPVPGIFLMEDNDGKYLIIDGHNRIITITRYARGEFSLKEVHQDLNGKSFQQLHPRNRIHFLRAIIHATIIREETNKKNMFGALELFRRLNTGGTTMYAHELRSALYYGNLIELIKEISQNDFWIKSYSGSALHLKDEETILRFFALHFDGDNYRAPMSTFLDKFLADNMEISRENAEEWRSIFLESLYILTNSIGENVFRRGRTWNNAIYDFAMNGMAEAIKLKGHPIPDRIIIAYNELSSSDDLLQTMSKSTDSTRNIMMRLEISRQFCKKII